MADECYRAGKVTRVPIIIVMGVTGSGKSTLGQALAHALHCRAGHQLARLF
jgi:adenylylsulfate kinase-like enzyme